MEIPEPESDEEVREQARLFGELYFGRIVKDRTNAMSARLTTYDGRKTESGAVEIVLVLAYFSVQLATTWAQIFALASPLIEEWAEEAWDQQFGFSGAVWTENNVTVEKAASGATARVPPPMTTAWRRPQAVSRHVGWQWPQWVALAVSGVAAAIVVFGSELRGESGSTLEDRVAALERRATAPPQEIYQTVQVEPATGPVIVQPENARRVRRYSSYE